MQWQAGKGDELPPSSPIESWTKDEPEGATGRQKGSCESTATSYTSSAMWSAAGSTPSTFLFDENEAGLREDGELEEAATTPRAEQSDPEEVQEERGRNPRSFVEKCDDVMSKHPYANTPSNCVTTPRKRSWAFSPVSEGRNRATQRLRLEEDVGNGAGMRLSSFHELAGNPWDGDENDRDRRRSIPAPVNMSTPRDAQPPLRNVVYHSGANMSGKAPTPHYASTVASSVYSRARGEPDEERAGRRGGRPATRYTAQTTPCSAALSRRHQDAMDMDEDEEENDGDALLRSLSRLRAQKERSRKELEELDERRRELKKAILKADSGEERGSRMDSHPQWRGGYAWAIQGLSEAGAWEMVKVRVATSKGVTIITHPRSLNNPRWVCGLVGFLRPDKDTIKETILGTLRSTYMLDRLADLTRSNTALSHIPEDRRVAHVLRSLEVKVTATKEGEYVANVYIMPPTDDMDAWREWADELRLCWFNAFLCGAGRARPAFWCAGCRGVDHETEGCFFPRMKGWKGPEAGSNSHTRLQITGLMRGSIGRGRGGSQRGGTRGGALQDWTQLNGNQGAWNSFAGPSRAPRSPRRGSGRGGSATRGTRGSWHGHWSPAMRR